MTGQQLGLWGDTERPDGQLEAFGLAETLTDCRVAELHSDRRPGQSVYRCPGCGRYEVWRRPSEVEAFEEMRQLEAEENAGLRAESGLNNQEYGND